MLMQMRTARRPAPLPAFASPAVATWGPPAVVAPETCPDKAKSAPLALLPTTAWASNLFARPGVTATGALSGAGADGLTTVASVLGVAGTGLGAYHGYRRTGSLGWTLAWAILGGLFPIITIPVAFAQGFGKPAAGFKR